MRWLVDGVFLLRGGLLGGGEGLGDVVEIVGGAVYADEGGKAFAVVVVDVAGGDEGVALEDEVDGFGLALGFFDGCAESFAGEDVAVDGDDLLAGEELGFVGRAVPADVGEFAFSVDADADGVPGVDAAAATAAGRGYGACGFGGLVGVDELVWGVMASMWSCMKVPQSYFATWLRSAMSSSRL